MLLQQRRFAPNTVRHYPDNCSPSSGMAVRLPSESLFAITGIRKRLQKELSEAGNAQKRDELEKLQDFRQELIDFRDELLRVAKLSYKPNLNDGVLITASPLWKLFRLKKWQNDLKACWKKLENGEYDWAHLAYSIWPDRVREKCKTDRSIAIAHDLEEICEVQPKKTSRGKEEGYVQ